MQVTLLPNGLYRVFDYRCQWAILYRVERGRIEYHSGGVDTPQARKALEAILD